MDVSFFLSNLQPAPVYDGAWQIAKLVVISISPLLLTAAILMRMSEVGLGSIHNSGDGSMTAALWDITLWAVMLGLYFGIGGLLLNFMNSIYALIDKVGSISEIAAQMQQFITTANTGVTQSLTDTITTGFKLGVVWVVITALYYLSLLIVVIEVAFLRFAHAVGLGFVFIYGLVAIPIAISTTFRHTKSWGTFVAFILIWPVVEGIMLGLFKLVFVAAAAAIANDHTNTAMSSEIAIKTLYTILNMIIAAVVIAAPLVAWAVISNSNGAGSLIAPFTAAAVAAGTATASAMQRRFGFQPPSIAGIKARFSARQGGGGGGGPGGGSALREPRKSPGPPPVSPAATATTPSTNNDTAKPNATAADSAKQAQRAQQRRGVLINRDLRKRTDK